MAWYTIAFLPTERRGNVGLRTLVNVSLLLSDVNPGSVKFSPTSIVFSANPVSETTGILTVVLAEPGLKSKVTSALNVEKNVLYR